MKNVVVIGDAMIDSTIYGRAEKLSPEAPIPVIQYKEVIDTPGGAVNVASNIKSLLGNDADVHLCGWMDDRFSDETKIVVCPATRTSIRLNIKRRIVDTCTGYQIVRLDNEKYIDCLNRPLDRIAILHYLNQVCPEAIVFSDYNKGAISYSLAKEVIRTFGGKSRIYVDSRDPNIQKYQGSTWITPNRKEFGAIVEHEKELIAIGLSEAETVYEICDIFKLNGLVVTKGEDGMSLYTEKQAFHVKATHKHVVDVTGAGDVALAGLIAAEMLGCSNKQELVEVANALAGESCMHKGTVILKPSLTERGHKWA